ncbi:hypothetical protein Pcinc_009796 [Petrolisthes cinctipes]|uniref:Uncharacterized protein n=1 Tax=Petrolisthes cinctipes TaxID=88211 RepID=A0AAE1G4L0_PETCI|nr:hypothetical protein Pcinc_009796 [Petrolisthes cinctipes]
MIRCLLFEHTRTAIQKPQDNDRSLKNISDTARADPAYTRLLEYVTSGFPQNRFKVNSAVFPYWKLRDSLYTDEELLHTLSIMNHHNTQLTQRARIIALHEEGFSSMGIAQ